ncbi:hypothetical protein MTBBW1_2130099 [Desulfamplus magnetovallimortis]|uniref:Uncharacterized protein n=1 Tax=Desulfamplus magnetovallimortis TaxID=1246637 RepID=A0A1W1HCI2_9BACT|nr:hypothetical protein [Desulfamplus magnetovallimortis]SLM30204.1 hypothetical protein MTBBW1_2130099 [Desulfamplus magnetovallimortis]
MTEKTEIKGNVEIVATSVDSVEKSEASEKIENKADDSYMRFETIKAIRETRESFKKKVDCYNDKYIKKTVDSGREFMKELQNDPLKKIDSIIEDSSKAVKTFKSDSRKKYDEVKTKSKEISGKFKESPFKYVGDVVKDAKADTEKKIEKYKENRKKFLEGVEKDVNIIRQDIMDAGKKVIDNLPMKKRVEKKISSTIEKFPSILNLPSKKEVEELISGLDSVSKKVDSLSKQASAA